MRQICLPGSTPETALARVLGNSAVTAHLLAAALKAVIGDTNHDQSREALGRVAIALEGLNRIEREDHT